jgi:SARP family transcriptional regulator, regulator of embCAB operon
MTAGLQVGFSVLGPVQMTIDGVAVNLGTPKQRAVLATLLINRNRAVSKDTLITDTWQNRPPANPAASLHTYVAEVRKLLKDAGLDATAVLATAAPGYRLTVADMQCDIGRFAAKHAAGVAAMSHGDFEQARLLLRAALDEWKGPALADLQDLHFAQAFAAAANRDRLIAIGHWAEAEIACGRGQDVLGELERLVAEYPYEEPLWVQLVTALYLSGRQAAALAACRRLREILDNDLALVPGPRIRELEEQVLRQLPLQIKQATQRIAIDTLTLTSRPTSQVSGPIGAALVETATGTSYPLAGGITKIGRWNDNDIVLSADEISRHHGAIVDTGAHYLMVDTNSRNGIEVGGQRITSSTVLADGSSVTIAGRRFMFQISPPNESSTELGDMPDDSLNQTL